MFWVTQAGWAKAVGTSDTAEINAPARVASMLLIFVSLNRRVLLARLHGNYDERPVSGQVAAVARRHIAGPTWSATRRPRSNLAAADFRDSRGCGFVEIVEQLQRIRFVGLAATLDCGQRAFPIAVAIA